MQNYKFYPEGDVDPASRNLGVVLSYTQELGLHFTGQKSPLPKDYAQTIRRSFTEGRAVMHILDEHFMTVRVLNSRAALREVFGE
jgi:hypothetical protein